MEIATGPSLAAALESADLPAAGLIFEATARPAGWEEGKATLMEAFAASRRAARDKAAIVFVVHHDDLLGRRGAPAAMVATALLSGARTAALEQAKAGAPVNVVAVEDTTAPDLAARWAARLTEPGGPTGELVRLSPSHLGKALP